MRTWLNNLRLRQTKELEQNPGILPDGVLMMPHHLVEYLHEF